MERLIMQNTLQAVLVRRKVTQLAWLFSHDLLVTRQLKHKPDTMQKAAKTEAMRSSTYSRMKLLRLEMRNRCKKSFWSQVWLFFCTGFGVFRFLFLFCILAFRALERFLGFIDVERRNILIFTDQYSVASHLS